MKSMRDTVPENELFGSKAENMYRDMYDKQLSMNISNGKGIGLANVIERQLGGKPEGDMTDKPLSDYLAKSFPVDSRTRASIENSHLEVGKISAHSSFKTSIDGAQDQQSAGAWDDAENFVKDVWPHALRAADALGVDAEVLMAQSALETGWGKYLPLHADGSNSFNLFGIKADSRWQGERVEITTREYRHGVMQHEKAEFRSYDSVGEAIDDYVDFIMTSPRYQKALEHAYDAEAYARELQQAGYATDPDYARKINRVRDNEILQNRVSELKNLNQPPLT